MRKDRTSIVTVFRVPETGCYGYSYHFAGYKPHQVIDTWKTLQEALNSCDPHLEHLREEPDGTDRTVMWRMTHLKLAELTSRRDAENIVIRPGGD